MNKLARVGVAAVLLVLGAVLSTSVATATPPAHKQAVVYTQSGESYASSVQETADACSQAVIALAQKHGGMSKKLAVKLHNQCLIQNGATL